MLKKKLEEKKSPLRSDRGLAVVQVFQPLRWKESFPRDGCDLSESKYVN